MERSYQTLDHLATCRLLEQKCQKGIKMCVVTVDFMKVLDSISHKSPMEGTRKMRNRTTKNQPLEETLCGRESDSHNGQGR